MVGVRGRRCVPEGVTLTLRQSVTKLLSEDIHILGMSLMRLRRAFGRCNRAVSTVISTILLVNIAMAAGVLYFAWSQTSLMKSYSVMEIMYRSQIERSQEALVIVWNAKDRISDVTTSTDMRALRERRGDVVHISSRCPRNDKPQGMYLALFWG